MPLNRNWSTQAVNQALANITTADLLHASTLFAFKQFIAGQNPVAAAGAWTVVSSSNSLVAGNADHWNSIADLVWANEGSPLSWIQFQSPAGWVPNGNFVYLLVSCEDTSTGNLRVEFSGGPFTGGTTTARPLTSGNNPGAINGRAVFQWQSNTVPLSAHWHGSRNTFGDFVFLYSRDGGGFASTVFFGCSLGSSLPEDGYPVVFAPGFADTAPGGAKRENWDRTNGFIECLGPGGSRMIGGNNTATSLGVLFTPVAGEVIFDRFNGGGDQQESSFYPAQPVWLWDLNNPHVSFRGRVVDVDMTTKNPVQTLQVPDISPTRCLIGDFFVPFTTPPTF